MAGVRDSKMKKHSIAKTPCGSCPYRKDVPSGIWEAHEYEKLASYDNNTGDQSLKIFLCHQRDGNLCAGWVACHGSDLLALRLAAIKGVVDASAFSYSTSTPVFTSGKEAATHGMLKLGDPDSRARQMISGLIRKK